MKPLDSCLSKYEHYPALCELWGLFSVEPPTLFLPGLVVFLMVHAWLIIQRQTTDLYSLFFAELPLIWYSTPQILAASGL